MLESLEPKKDPRPNTSAKKMIGMIDMVVRR
jgi:hypothetical protein